MSYDWALVKNSEPGVEIDEAHAVEIEAEDAGVLANLRRGFLDRDEERPFAEARSRREEVEPEHRLARAGATTDEIRATRHEPAVEHLVQSGDARRHA